MSAEEKLRLWEEYNKNKTPELREQIIIEYAGLVKIVAGKLSIYLGYNVEYDDLVGYGMFGLIDAIDKYDFDKGVKFETYASLRIRGAILDQVRRMDWLPRTVRQKQKRMDAAYQKLEAANGQFASDEELAAELEISVEELGQWQAQTKAAGIVSLDEYLEQGTENGIVGTSDSEGYAQPEKQLEQKEMKELLVQSLEALTEKEKKVILLYYYEELTLKEISEVLEVSESRISQLHTKAIQRLRLKLGNQIELFF